MQKQDGKGRDREKCDETKVEIQRSEWFRAPRRSASSDGEARCSSHTRAQHQRETQGDHRFEKYEQHAGRERIVRLIEDILADPRVIADGTAQMEQSTAADFNKLVCN